MKALINLGREGSVDFNKNPVLHCMSIVSPVAVVVLLAVTGFHHLSTCSSFPQTPIPVFLSLFTKIKAYPIRADYLKGHVTTTNTWVFSRKGVIVLIKVW